jgi:hypothetical protein
MKIKININHKALDPADRSYDFGFEISGSGTEENPKVINSDDYFDIDLFTAEIHDSESFLTLKLRDFGILRFFNSKNITMQNSQLVELTFVGCENVVLNVINTDYIKVENCRNLTLLSGKVRYLHVIASFNIKIANSTIQKLVRERNTELKIETSMIERTKLKN